MKRKKISKRELYKLVEEHGIRPTGRKLGIPESTIRNRLKDYDPGIPEHGVFPDKDVLAPPHIDENGVDTVDFSSSRRFILTSAQNNCDVHEPFLRNLKAFARHAGADILCSFIVYDKAGYKGIVRKGEYVPHRDIWWDKRVLPYATNTRARLTDDLAFAGEMDLLATMVDPLSQFENYCGRSSLVVPHNKFAFKVVPARKGETPKELYTCGSVTKPRFVQRKAGQIAAFHHVIGALYVEVSDRDGSWRVHHLNADRDGNFFVFDRYVVDGKVKKNRRFLAAILGDIHAEKMSVIDHSLDLVKTLDPDHLFLHDTLDFTSANHHNTRDPFFQVETANRTALDDIKRSGDVINHLAYAFDGETHVVPSNHHEHFERWLKETDWRQRPKDAKFYLESALRRVKASEDGESIDMYQWAIQEYLRYCKGVDFIEEDGSRVIGGVECAIHGHLGANGARGNPKAYGKIGFKVFTGHTHSPSIYHGCYTVGVAGDLDMRYNRGLSGWMRAHGVIYPNGKRAFFFEKGDNREWRILT